MAGSRRNALGAVQDFANRAREIGAHPVERLEQMAEFVAACAGKKFVRLQVATGGIKYRESVVQGLENAPRAFLGLLKGSNFGKQLVRLA